MENENKIVNIDFSKPMNNVQLRMYCVYIASTLTAKDINRQLTDRAFIYKTQAIYNWIKEQ
jgi:hypothetical protein